MKNLINQFKSLPIFFQSIFLGIFFLAIAFVDSFITGASDWSDLHWWGNISAIISMVFLGIGVIRYLVIPIGYWVIVKPIQWIINLFRK